MDDLVLFLSQNFLNIPKNTRIKNIREIRKEILKALYCEI